MSLYLRILENPNFQTLLRELTWAEMDDNFIALFQLIQNAGSENFPSVEPYDPLKTYNPGEDPRYVTYDNNLWLNISLTSHSNVTPGTDDAIWKNTSIGELAHEQNTDVRLRRAQWSANPGEIDLTSGIYRDVNFINVDNATNDPLAVSLKSRVASPLSFVEHTYFIQNDPQSYSNITLADDANQLIGFSLSLAPGDWCIVMGNVFTSAGYRTLMIASNKLYGAGGGNPFNQSLNIEDGVVFSSLRITGRAGTGTRVAFYNAAGDLVELAGAVLDGNILKLPDDITLSKYEADPQKALTILAGKTTPVELKSLPDTVLQYLTFYDPVLDVNQKWGPVNGVWTLIETL